MTSQQQTYAIAAARTVMVVIFFLSGLSKIGSAESMRGYMESMGVPGTLLWSTILFEIGAALLIVAGYKTRVVALFLAAFSIVTAMVFHSNFADQIQMVMFLKNLSMAGGFFLLACVGAGDFGLDARFEKAERSLRIAA
ncbi:putative oxidoreductase [Ensifer sp. KUDG1]|uniref:DoxX family protein n=1 Tax=Ensifer sp. KUDG1 TaxID=3373919 RepID=UPI003D1B2747